jgi:hypothetical protein
MKQRPDVPKTAKTKRHRDRRHPDGVIEVGAPVATGDGHRYEILLLSSITACASDPDQLARMKAGLPRRLVKHADQILRDGPMHAIMGYDAESRTAVWFIYTDGKISSYIFPEVESIEDAQEISDRLSGTPLETLNVPTIQAIYAAVTGYEELKGSMQ